MVRAGMVGDCGDTRSKIVLECQYARAFRGGELAFRVTPGRSELKEFHCDPRGSRRNPGAKSGGVLVGVEIMRPVESSIHLFGFVLLNE